MQKAESIMVDELPSKYETYWYVNSQETDACQNMLSQGFFLRSHTYPSSRISSPVTLFLLPSFSLITTFSLTAMSVTFAELFPLDSVQKRAETEDNKDSSHSKAHAQQTNEFTLTSLESVNALGQF